MSAAGEFCDTNRQIRVNRRTPEDMSCEGAMETLVHGMRHACRHEAMRRPEKALTALRERRQTPRADHI